MYHCGPTVYHYPHIGNIRSYVFADTLKRMMLAHGFRVDQVINITDVGHLVSDADTGEDKMEKARAREGKSAREIARFYTDFFIKNLIDINVDIKDTQFPSATQFISEQIELIESLESKGLTYTTNDGVYFDTSKFPAYGDLGNIDLKGLRENESDRVVVQTDKRNPTDFALWKFSPKNDGKNNTENTGAGENNKVAPKREQEWQSPWGIGFPGWHIECSAMAMSLLGETIDIHTGGIDHIPVHHNNEIAQSEGSTGKQFARFWLHNAFLNITSAESDKTNETNQDGQKMSKSSGDFLTLTSITDKGFSALDYRYFLLGARYSTPMNFSWEALESAHNARTKLSNALREMFLEKKVEKEAKVSGMVTEKYWQKALGAVSDDLDTPKVLALQWEIVKDTSLSSAQKKNTLLKIDSLLGLFDIDKIKNETKKLQSVEIPESVQKLLDMRTEVRAQKDWKKSDELRSEIEVLGYGVKDLADKQEIFKL